MNAGEALKVVGCNRVVWIDDKFNDSADEIAELLWRNSEVAASCSFPELKGIFEKAPINEENARHELAQALAELTGERISSMKRIFFEKEAEKNVFVTAELSDNKIEKICKILSIKKEDQWTFGRAATEIESMESGLGGDVMYIVDLNEAGGGDLRGLDILRQLNSRSSKA
jgi:hypothetical protein